MKYAQPASTIDTSSNKTVDSRELRSELAVSFSFLYLHVKETAFKSQCEKEMAFKSQCQKETAFKSQCEKEAAFKSQCEKETCLFFLNWWRETFVRLAKVSPSFSFWTNPGPGKHKPQGYICFESKPGRQNNQSLRAVHRLAAKAQKMNEKFKMEKSLCRLQDKEILNFSGQTKLSCKGHSSKQKRRVGGRFLVSWIWDVVVQFQIEIQLPVNKRTDPCTTQLQKCMTFQVSLQLSQSNNSSSL